MEWQRLWISERLACGFFAYLMVLAVVRVRGRARTRVVLAGAVCVMTLLVLPQLPTSGPPQVVREWIPGVYLMQGYWLSGCFFDRPMARLETRLLGVDTWLAGLAPIRRLAAGTPPWVYAGFELTYLLTYPLVPAGLGLALALGGRDRADGFWTTVLLAAFTCYGALPWIQTRPPRAVGPAPPPARGATVMHRLNVAVLDRISVQANTIPSGHAATSAAVALSVATTEPTVGAPLLLLAAGIAIATVIGRYHYVVDSVLGLAVGIGAWWVGVR